MFNTFLQYLFNVWKLITDCGLNCRQLPYYLTYTDRSVYTNFFGRVVIYWFITTPE